MHRLHQSLQKSIIRVEEIASSVIFGALRPKIVYAHEARVSLRNDLVAVFALKRNPVFRRDIYFRDEIGIIDPSQINFFYSSGGDDIAREFFVPDAKI